MAFRKTVALDFDGVLHWYRRGWQDGSIYDEPVPGAVEFVAKLAEHYRLVVFTTRDAAQVRPWLVDKGFAGIEEVTNTKPLAVAYVDDRAVHFTGHWPSVLGRVREVEREHDAKARGG
jgi:hypothetical protein